MEGRRRKKKPLSRLAKTFLSYALIAALALPPQAAWATIPEGTMDEDGALAIGVDSSAGHMCTSVGSNALAGLQSSTFGYQANAEGTYSSTFGYQANAYATNSVALGANSVASEADTVPSASSTQQRRIVNVADGTVAEGSTDAVTGGQLYRLGSEVARIVGGQVTYDGKFSTGALFNIGGNDYYTIEAALNELYNGTAGSTGGAVGEKIVIDPSKGKVTIARGKNIKISEMKGQYVIDVSESPTFSAVYAGRADIGGITVGSDGINMGGKKITGLAEGELGANSTEAVTGGQLYGLGESVSKALGGTSAFVDGKITAGIEVGGTAYASVQEALNAVNTGGGTAAANAVQYDDDSKATVTLKDKDGGAVKLTNLAEGEITAGSTDAVTGGQLWNAYKRMDDLNESINIVGAHAAALSGLHPIDYNPYEPTTLSAAVGTYRDEYAVAVGVFHYMRENVLFNLGASICSDGDVMGRAGISLAVGKGGRKKPELARDMVGMQQQMIAMQAMLEELKEENAKNKETIKKNEETIKELKEALGKKK